MFRHESCSRNQLGQVPDSGVVEKLPKLWTVGFPKCPTKLQSQNVSMHFCITTICKTMKVTKREDSVIDSRNVDFDDFDEFCISYIGSSSFDYSPNSVVNTWGSYGKGKRRGVRLEVANTIRGKYRTFVLF